MKRFLGIFALCVWGQSAVSDAKLVGEYVWTDTDRNFGGMSGFHLDTNGIDFVAVSDRGNSITGQLIREAGRITGVRSDPIRPLLKPDGKRVKDRSADAEGLAISRTGTAYVSFEGNARVSIYEDIAGLPTPISDHPAFDAMQYNASLEALAISQDGAIFTIPERSGRAGRPFPVYRYIAGVWDIPFTIPRRGPFLIAGADIGPDGLLYILERDFTGVGFRTRVRRFSQDGRNEETLIKTGNATHDNLEGISVWHDGTHMRITMIADDNFRFFQQTEIVEYQLID